MGRFCACETEGRVAAARPSAERARNRRREVFISPVLTDEISWPRLQKKSLRKARPHPRPCWFGGCQHSISELSREPWAPGWRGPEIGDRARKHRSRAVLGVSNRIQNPAAEAGRKPVGEESAISICVPLDGPESRQGSEHSPGLKPARWWRRRAESGPGRAAEGGVGRFGPVARADAASGCCSPSTRASVRSGTNLRHALEDPFPSTSPLRRLAPTRGGRPHPRMDPLSVT